MFPSAKTLVKLMENPPFKIKLAQDMMDELTAIYKDLFICFKNMEITALCKDKGYEDDIKKSIKKSIKIFACDANVILNKILKMLVKLFTDFTENLFGIYDDKKSLKIALKSTNYNDKTKDALFCEFTIVTKTIFTKNLKILHHLDLANMYKHDNFDIDVIFPKSDILEPQAEIKNNENGEKNSNIFELFGNVLSEIREILNYTSSKLKYYDAIFPIENDKYVLPDAILCVKSDLTLISVPIIYERDDGYFTYRLDRKEKCVPYNKFNDGYPKGIKSFIFEYVEDGSTKPLWNLFKSHSFKKVTELSYITENKFSIWLLKRLDRVIGKNIVDDYVQFRNETKCDIEGWFRYDLYFHIEKGSSDSEIFSLCEEFTEKLGGDNQLEYIKVQYPNRFQSLLI